MEMFDRSAQYKLDLIKWKPSKGGKIYLFQLFRQKKVAFLRIHLLNSVFEIKPVLSQVNWDPVKSQWSKIFPLKHVEGKRNPFISQLLNRMFLNDGELSVSMRWKRLLVIVIFSNFEIGHRINEHPFIIELSISTEVCSNVALVRLQSLRDTWFDPLKDIPVRLAFTILRFEHFTSSLFNKVVKSHPSDSLQPEKSIPIILHPSNWTPTRFDIGKMQTYQVDIFLVANSKIQISEERSGPSVTWKDAASIIVISRTATFLD